MQIATPVSVQAVDENASTLGTTCKNNDRAPALAVAQRCCKTMRMMTPGTRARIAAALQAEMAAQHVTATQLSKAAGVNPRTVKRILDGEPAYDHNVGKVATTLGWSSDQLTELLNDRDHPATEHTPDGIMRGYRNVLAFAEEARDIGVSAERIRAMTTAALDILEESNRPGFRPSADQGAPPS